MVQLVGKSELYDATIAADELEPEKIKLTSIGVSTTNSTSVVWTATRMRAQKVGCERCSLSLFKCSWRSNRSRISRIHEPSFGQPRAIATSACRPGPGGGLFSRFLDSMPLLFDTLPGYTNTVHFMDPFSPGERLPAIDAHPRECYTWGV